MANDYGSTTPSDSGTMASYRSYPPPSNCYSDDEYTETEPSDSDDETEKTINIIVKDAHDVNGDGMLFSLGISRSFKSIFDGFRAASCQACRPADRIRFKVEAQKLKDEDTPTTISALRNFTLSIRAFSNKAGLCCSACQVTGYPTTKGTKFDGDFPLPQLVKPIRKQLVRLLFTDQSGTVTGITVNSSYQLKHAMRDYASRRGHKVSTLRFFLDDERLADDDTPEQMGMQNDTTVNVHEEQLGG